MKLIRRNEALLFISMVFITISMSVYLDSTGLNKIFEYAGFAILLAGIYLKSLRHIKVYKSAWQLLLIVLLLFCCGLSIQNLPMSKIASLMISMFILASFSIMPCGYINNYSCFRVMGVGILYGIIFNVVIAAITRSPVLTGASEGIIVNFGFNAGFVHRNYFSYTIIASFVAIYISHRFGQQKRYDKKIFTLEVLLLILTNSKSSYIIFILFIYIGIYNKISISRYQKTITRGLVFILACMTALPIYNFLAAYSETFYYRTNGLTNYLTKYGSDWYHLLLGNAEMAFRDSGWDYYENIRSIIGYSGSTELVVLNVLIKNGLIGLVGYILIFIRYVMRLNFEKNADKDKVILAIIITFGISAFVESYVANIHYIYTVATYLMIVSMESLAYENWIKEKYKVKNWR